MISKRSESDVTSSSSADTSNTAQPESRKLTNLRWINSIAPISTPRVGCDTSNSFGRRSNSRPMISFCWLPPDNQQKLIIGREFDLRPKLLLVSQPTRGVDIGAIEFIHRKLVALRDAGCAVLLVSAELEEVTALADRLLIIHDGRIVGEVDPKVATVEEIGLMMTGGVAE